MPLADDAHTGLIEPNEPITGIKQHRHDALVQQAQSRRLERVPFDHHRDRKVDGGDDRPWAITDRSIQAQMGATPARPFHEPEHRYRDWLRGERRHR